MYRIDASIQNGSVLGTYFYLEPLYVNI